MRQDTPSKERVEVRLTPEEKTALKMYAAKHNKTLSEVVRELCYKIFNDKEN